MNRLTTLLFLVISFADYAQDKYQIKDITTNEPIPFAKIIFNELTPVLADIDGFFTMDSLVFKLKISSFGYKDTTLFSNLITDNCIFLTESTTLIDEINIIPGENPAHRIMNIVIENKKKNSPTHGDAFTYNSYSKYIFDINEEALQTIDTADSNVDAHLIKLKNYFNDNHLFLIENISKRTFQPPSLDVEEITAFKTSGFNDPLFSSFANELQSFSFYENQFTINGKSYINPIAFGGIKRYLFLIEDTIINLTDTTFTISFRPRKNKNFDGLKGFLYINTNGYAIEKVIVEPADTTSSSQIKVIQEYQFIEHKKWFPIKLSTEMKLPGFEISDLKNGYIVAKGSMYINNIILNPSGLKKINLNNTSLSTNDDAANKKDSEWDSTRIYGITLKEKNTYKTMDSISKEFNLNLKIKAIQSLMVGKLPLGYINLDLTKIIDYKLYEGYRIGSGIETSSKISKRIKFGGYFAYGTKDQAWKYGAFTEIKLYQKKSGLLNLKYQNDIVERGGYTFQKEAFNLNSTLNYRQLYIKSMDYQRLVDLSFSTYISSNFNVCIGTNYQRIWSTEDYLFKPLNTTLYTTLSSYDLAEGYAEIKWNIKEKMVQLGELRIGKGTKYPCIALKITKGFKNIEFSAYNYIRLHFDVNQEIPIRTIGKFNWMFHFGQTIGDVPLLLQQVAIGTGGNWNISVKNTFETMFPATFYSKQQFNLFTRFSFREMKTKFKIFKPKITLHHGLGYGYFTNKTEHSIKFNTMNKGYCETGMILDGLINSGFSGFGLGVFYRYGEYASFNVLENFMYKVSFTMKLE
ncbi:MAG: hypothetical protein HYR91_04935 [Flavobacteriia bacterium]|nr:hypothetical protein [Flavobacteriia bacterium]